MTVEAILPPAEELAARAKSRWPGESAEYRAARTALLAEEIDLRRHIEGDLLNQKVEAVMTKKPITIRSNQLAGEALGEMNRRRITAFFVIDSSHPVGILHMHDCVRAGIT